MLSEFIRTCWNICIYVHILLHDCFFIGTIPLDGHFFLVDDPIFKQMLTIGPIARYVEDLYLSMKVLAASPACRLPPLFDEPVDIKNLKFYYFDSISGIFGVRSTTSEIKETIRKAKQYLITKGASVKEVKIL